MRLKNFFLMIGSILIMAAFQNCGGVKFADSAAESASKLEAQNQTQTDDGDVDDETGELEPDEHVCHNPRGGRKYVTCILEGPGKSLKLGLDNSGLTAVHSVSDSVCVTRKACFEMVSQKFDVKGAYDRGHCRHSSLKLTNAEVAELLK